MTDPRREAKQEARSPGAGTARRRPPRRKPKAWPTVLAALAVFGVAFEFLAFQLHAGRDPAIGATASTAPAKARPDKKIVITKVIPAAGGGSSATSSSTSGTVAAPAPVTTSSS
jgi:hypothetical protein